MKNLLKSILAVGILLTIFLTVLMQSKAAPGAAQPGSITATPRITATLPSPTNTPYSLPTPTGKQPPACTFPLPQTTITDSPKQEYAFSEPKIVYTPAPDDSYVEIVEWLPDNRRILVVQHLRDSTQQKIELFDSETGERQVYAIREQTEYPPAWNQEIGGVVYPVNHVLKFINNIPEISRQVWVSYGNPQAAQMLAENLPQFAMAVKPGGGDIAYFSNKQISRKNGLMQNMAPVSFDVTQWNYRNLKSSIFPLMYNMTWRPGSSQVFLYTFADGNPGYTFLLDVETGEICELDFGGWAVIARWSPNGRYLAIDRSQADGVPVGATDLTVIDTVTGNVYTSDVTSRNVPGIHAVGSIAWAPDNRHLLVLGKILSFPHCAPNCNDDTKLYLVDFITGQVIAPLPEQQFIPNFAGTSLAWSPDGSKVIALCYPGIRCTISVQVNRH